MNDVKADMLRALKELLEACEADAGIPGENDGDDESVALYGDGTPAGALTFGMLRRSRAAITAAEAAGGQAVPIHLPSVAGESGGDIKIAAWHIFDEPYVKEFYEVLPLDGTDTIIRDCWPNAGKMGATDGSGRSWKPWQCLCRIQRGEPYANVAPALAGTDEQRLGTARPTDLRSRIEKRIAEIEAERATLTDRDGMLKRVCLSERADELSAFLAPPTPEVERG